MDVISPFPDEETEGRLLLHVLTQYLTLCQLRKDKGLPILSAPFYRKLSLEGLNAHLPQQTQDYTQVPRSLDSLSSAPSPSLNVTGIGPVMGKHSHTRAGPLGAKPV